MKLNFITLESLLEMIANGEEFKLVEVLAEEEYAGGHIPGAINLPLAKLEDLAKQKLKKSDTIVVYCSSYSCQASTKAARRLLPLPQVIIATSTLRAGILKTPQPLR